MKFHHIGVATRDLNNSIKSYQSLGFKAGEKIFDSIQQVTICFMEKADHPLIELIEPANEKSPVNRILDSVGTSPYHFCYYSDNLTDDISLLKSQKFIIVVKPVEAVAFGNDKICFCYNKDFGLMELIERRLES